MTGHPNQQFIDGLRAMADFVEKHPQPYTSAIVINIPCDSTKEFRESTHGAGKLSKMVTDSWFYLIKKFPGDISINWVRPRDTVCERVVTGIRTVEKPIMQQVGTETVTEEICEWKCPPSILAMTEPDPFLPTVEALTNG